jgi:hypothetical protein
MEGSMTSDGMAGQSLRNGDLRVLGSLMGREALQLRGPGINVMRNGSLPRPTQEDRAGAMGGILGWRERMAEVWGNRQQRAALQGLDARASLVRAPASR